MKFVLPLFIYLVLAVIALFVAASVWEHRVVGVFYRCSDSVPFFEFIPPFVHSGQTGDAYLVPEDQVYRTWYAYIAASLLLPAVPIALLFVLHRRYWRKHEAVA